MDIPTQKPIALQMVSAIARMVIKNCRLPAKNVSSQCIIVANSINYHYICDAACEKCKLSSNFILLRAYCCDNYP